MDPHEKRERECLELMMGRNWHAALLRWKVMREALITQ